LVRTAEKKGDYLVVSLSEHANTIEIEFESRKIRENRVRKSYSWNGVELVSVAV
jgi:hypothetical protein